MIVRFVVVFVAGFIFGAALSEGKQDLSDHLRGARPSGIIGWAIGTR